MVSLRDVFRPGYERDELLDDIRYHVLRPFRPVRSGWHCLRTRVRRKPAEPTATSAETASLRTRVEGTEVRLTELENRPELYGGLTAGQVQNQLRHSSLLVEFHHPEPGEAMWLCGGGDPGCRRLHHGRPLAICVKQDDRTGEWIAFIGNPTRGKAVGATPRVALSAYLLEYLTRAPSPGFEDERLLEVALRLHPDAEPAFSERLARRAFGPSYVDREQIWKPPPAAGQGPWTEAELRQQAAPVSPDPDVVPGVVDDGGDAEADHGDPGPAGEVAPAGTDPDHEGPE